MRGKVMEDEEIRRRERGRKGGRGVEEGERREGQEEDKRRRSQRSTRRRRKT
jgi:hypothetical protein